MSRFEASLSSKNCDTHFKCTLRKRIYCTLYRYCATDATVNCSSLCCNGYTLDDSASNVSKRSQTELHVRCNNKIQCSLSVTFATNKTDHYEFVSVSYNCIDVASLYVSGATFSSLFTSKAIVTASSQFSESNNWTDTAISTRFPTSTWLDLKQTRLLNQTKKQTSESANVPVIPIVASAVIIVIIAGIGVFLIWRKRRRRSRDATYLNPKPEYLSGNATHANDNYDSISHATDVNPEPEVLHRYSTNANNTYDSISLVGIRNIPSSFAAHEAKSDYPGNDYEYGQALNLDDMLKSSETPSSFSKEAYHTYFNLELENP